MDGIGEVLQCNKLNLPGKVFSTAPSLFTLRNRNPRAYFLGLHSPRMTTETPFRPREKLIDHQKYFQSIHKHTYLKGPLDKVTSVAIPIAFAATSLFLIGRGIYNMSHGIGKKE
ncbi:hypothetical protein OIU85_002845 [Salix viminalis]|uniref:Cytochrome-c oxidase n=1 Tax=Salix viminalis TaxID=40686 RepID=A0A9Q0VQG6_SALVM|nr:hypothetical protein OIU85_002845 [Salix viminalis]